MLWGAALGGMENSSENVLNVGGAVLSGDFCGSIINRRTERDSHISSLGGAAPGGMGNSLENSWGEEGLHLQVKRKILHKLIPVEWE